MLDTNKIRPLKPVSIIVGWAGVSGMFGEFVMDPGICPPVPTAGRLSALDPFLALASFLDKSLYLLCFWSRVNFLNISTPTQLHTDSTVKLTKRQPVIPKCIAILNFF